MATRNPVRERIVDAALAIADRVSWEAVRLHDVADELGITLDELRRHFREKEDVAEAWFDRADGAMLQAAEAPAFHALPARRRLHWLIMAWLGALEPHRKATRQMIYGKLEPGHLHVQIPGLLRVSRTVQWLREAAHRDATFMRRALEETGLTSIYLATFFYWMRDDTPDAAATSRLLDSLLGLAGSLERTVYGRPGSLRGAPAPDGGARSPEQAPAEGAGERA